MNFSGDFLVVLCQNYVVFFVVSIILLTRLSINQSTMILDYNFDVSGMIHQDISQRDW